MTAAVRSDGGPVAYLDHAASTPMRPEAVEAMLPWLGGRCGNPSGAHRLAREARTAIDDARDAVADAVGVSPGGVIFTSGGTEADNLAVFGTCGPRRGAATTTPVCSAVEHHAVLDPVVSLGGRTVAVDGAGRIDLDHLAAVLGASSDVGLVSVMLANNETGVRQPLDEVAEVVRTRAPGALLHTDAVQAACWTDVRHAAATADLVTLSAHKLGGPKGVGVLAVRDHVVVAPRQVGGGQERGRRSGTQDVAGIVATGVAVAAADATRTEAVATVGAMADRLRSGLLGVAGLVDTTAAVPSGSRLPNIVHVVVEGVETEALIVLLEDRGVMVSAAASCASGAIEPSHVLAAMGIDAATASGSVRFSLGWCSTDADVDRALAAVPAAVAQLREGGRGADRPGTARVVSGHGS